MVSIQPTGAVLGATVTGIDLAQPIPPAEFGRILRALGQYGVLRFPGQKLDIGDVKRFSELFGEIQGNPVRAMDRTQPFPEVGILSNIKENGAYIGSPDAGQDWHTDMSYRDTMGFVNVLYGIRIPHRAGKPLGGTEFSNMHAAYDALPEQIKTKLDGMTVTHNFEKFWEHMRQHKNSDRPAMTEEQRKRRPPAVHPVFLTHPITGRKVLYCNEGYAVRINELPDFVYFNHQVHVQAGFDCGKCHGDVAGMDRVAPAHPLDMGFCVGCHREQQFSHDCLRCHR